MCILITLSTDVFFKNSGLTIRIVQNERRTNSKLKMGFKCLGFGMFVVMTLSMVYLFHWYIKNNVGIVRVSSPVELTTITVTNEPFVNPEAEELKMTPRTRIIKRSSISLKKQTKPLDANNTGDGGRPVLGSPSQEKGIKTEKSLRNEQLNDLHIDSSTEEKNITTENSWNNEQLNDLHIGSSSQEKGITTEKLLKSEKLNDLHIDSSPQEKGVTTENLLKNEQLNDLHIGSLSQEKRITTENVLRNEQLNDLHIGSSSQEKGITAENLLKKKEQLNDKHIDNDRNTSINDTLPDSNIKSKDTETVQNPLGVQDSKETHEKEYSKGMKSGAPFLISAPLSVLVTSKNETDLTNKPIKFEEIGLSSIEKNNDTNKSDTLDMGAKINQTIQSEDESKNCTIDWDYIQQIEEYLKKYEHLKEQIKEGKIDTSMLTSLDKRDASVKKDRASILEESHLLLDDIEKNLTALLSKSEFGYMDNLQGDFYPITEVSLAQSIQGTTNDNLSTRPTISTLNNDSYKPSISGNEKNDFILNDTTLERPSLVPEKRFDEPKMLAEKDPSISIKPSIKLSPLVDSALKPRQPLLNQNLRYQKSVESETLTTNESILSDNIAFATPETLDLRSRSNESSVWSENSTVVIPKDLNLTLVNKPVENVTSVISNSLDSSTAYLEINKTLPSENDSIMISEPPGSYAHDLKINESVQNKKTRIIPKVVAHDLNKINLEKNQKTPPSDSTDLLTNTTFLNPYESVENISKILHPAVEQVNSKNNSNFNPYIADSEYQIPRDHFDHTSNSKGSIFNSSNMVIENRITDESGHVIERDSSTIIPNLDSLTFSDANDFVHSILKTEALEIADKYSNVTVAHTDGFEISPENIDGKTEKVNIKDDGENTTYTSSLNKKRETSLGGILNNPNPVILETSTPRINLVHHTFAKHLIPPMNLVLGHEQPSSVTAPPTSSPIHAKEAVVDKTNSDINERLNTLNPSRVLTEENHSLNNFENVKGKEEVDSDDLQTDGKEMRFKDEIKNIEPETNIHDEESHENNSRKAHFVFKTITPRVSMQSVEVPTSRNIEEKLDYDIFEREPIKSELTSLLERIIFQKENEQKEVDEQNVRKSMDSSYSDEDFTEDVNSNQVPLESFPSEYIEDEEYENMLRELNDVHFNDDMDNLSQGNGNKIKRENIEKQSHEGKEQNMETSEENVNEEFEDSEVEEAQTHPTFSSRIKKRKAKLLSLQNKLGEAESIEDDTNIIKPVLGKKIKPKSIVPPSLSKKPATKLPKPLKTDWKSLLIKKPKKPLKYEVSEEDPSEEDVNENGLPDIVYIPFKNTNNLDVKSLLLLSNALSKGEGNYFDNTQMAPQESMNPSGSNSYNLGHPQYTHPASYIGRQAYSNSLREPSHYERYGDGVPERSAWLRKRKVNPYEDETGSQRRGSFFNLEQPTREIASLVKSLHDLSTQFKKS